MSKESKNMIVPKLRFPEFKEEWKENEMGNLYSFLVTNSFSRDNLNYANGAVKNIHYGDIHTKFARTFDIKKETVPFINEDISIDKIREECYCQEGDIIFADASEDLKDVGKSIEVINLNNEKLISGLHTLLARQKEKKLIVGFGAYLFHSDFIKKQIQKEAQGTKVYALSTGRLSNIKIAYPKNSAEQQKIASCLSSLDDLNTAENQKLEALKAHKKGLMQQLFPANGQITPKLRFEEFRRSGEWQECQLGDVTSYFKGFAFKSKDYKSSGKRIIRVSDMGFDYIKGEDNAIYVSEENANQYDKWKVAKDDLLVTTVGSKPPVYDSLVGRTIVVKSKDEGSLLNQNAVCLRAKKTIEQSFLNALFKRLEYITFIESIIRGNANQGSITLENLFEFKLLIPDLEEQQKIASCLSSLDELITSQAEKIEALKEHKKGLMQGLFP